MKLFRKYLWQLVGALLGLLAIFATYHAVFLSRPTKALRVIVDSPVSLVDIRPEAAEDIEVFYRGEAVASVSLLQVSIENSGDQPIVKDDYSRPLSFSFSPEYFLADAAVTASEPPNIGMGIRKTSDYRAETEPALLNPNDTVHIRFVVIGASSESVLDSFEVDGRIAGVREIEVLSSSEQASPRWLEASEVMLAMLGIVVSLISSIFTERLAGSALRVLRRLSRDLRERPSPPQQLVILSGMYGAQGKANNVTEILKSKMREGRLEIFVSNDDLGGDPIPGVVKQLEVAYSYGGKEYSATVKEREKLSLP